MLCRYSKIWAVYAALRGPNTSHALHHFIQLSCHCTAALPWHISFVPRLPDSLSQMGKCCWFFITFRLNFLLYFSIHVFFLRKKFMCLWWYVTEIFVGSLFFSISPQSQRTWYSKLTRARKYRRQNILLCSLDIKMEKVRSFCFACKGMQQGKQYWHSLTQSQLKGK